MLIKVKFVTFLMLASNLASTSTSKSPVIIIPGTGGNHIEAKLTGKKSKPAWYCLSSTVTFFTLWFDLSSPFPGFTKCWADNIRLEWDKVNHTASDVQGVETRIPGFGGTESIECLDKFCAVPYMKSLVEFLVANGYERGKDLRGAPYDFRYSPDTVPHDYFKNLKALIEDTYKSNDNHTVTLVTHSYGGLMTLYFLNMTSTAWKQRHIKQWVPVSVPFGGSILEALVFASGFVDKRLEGIVKPFEVRGVQRSFTSNLVMLPSTLSWNDDYVIARTHNEKTFKLTDMWRYLDQVGFPEGTEMIDHVVNTTALMMTRPEIPIFCFYGNKPNSTVREMIFGNEQLVDQTPEIKYGSGDESVNLESLALCEMFKSSQNESVTVEVLPNVGHLDILENKDLFSALKSLLT